MIAFIEFVGLVHSESRHYFILLLHTHKILIDVSSNRSR